MSKSIPVRIAGLIILFFAAVIGPWQLALFFLLVSAWRFPHFYEALIPAVSFDLLYGGFMASILAVLVVALFDELRQYLVMSRL